VLFIDVINVKIRDGHVANRPIYTVLGVTADGGRDSEGCGSPTTLGGGDPDPQHLLVAVQVHADDQVGSLVVHRVGVADLDHQRA